VMSMQANHPGSNEVQWEEMHVQEL
jgi:hypothetical protein